MFTFDHYCNSTTLEHKHAHRLRLLHYYDNLIATYLLALGKGRFLHGALSYDMKRRILYYKDKYGNCSQINWQTSNSVVVSMGLLQSLFLNLPMAQRRLELAKTFHVSH